MLFISLVKLTIIKTLFVPTFVILLISLSLVPIIGIEVKGSKRWLDLIFFRFQPIEFIKPFFILMVAKILSHDDFKINKFSYFLSFLVLLLLIIFLLNQPDVGQSILLIGTWIAIVFVSGINLIYIFSFLGISLGLITSLLTIFPSKFGYITKRLEVFSLILLKEIVFNLKKH